MSKRTLCPRENPQLKLSASDSSTLLNRGQANWTHRGIAASNGCVSRFIVPLPEGRRGSARELVLLRIEKVDAAQRLRASAVHVVGVSHPFRHSRGLTQFPQFSMTSPHPRRLDRAVSSARPRLEAARRSGTVKRSRFHSARDWSTSDASCKIGRCRNPGPSQRLTDGMC